jgi:cell division protein FtsZ
MEVDEAANHIRELVDPDANIIWGSAFNENLEGKIRVSVVATGIDGTGEPAAAAPATRSFSFAPARTAAPAPVAEEAVEPAVEETPVAAAPEVEDSDPAPGFSLGDHAEAEAPQAEAEEEPMELSEVAATYDDTADELVLSEPEAPAAAYQPASAAAAPAPAEEAPARAVGGGTLFERMSRLSRGSASPDNEEDDGKDKDDGVDIPRFLGRQNNQ